MSSSYYVYILLDPRNDQPFYVGKGTGKRALTHLWNISRAHNAFKDSKIKSIRASGLEPIIHFFAENIDDENHAYVIEAALIQHYGRKGYELEGILTNVCIDLRPPSLRGRTYEEIFGSKEKVEAVLSKRRQTKLSTGRKGGVSNHTLESRQKISASCAIAATTRNCSHSEETKKKIGVQNSKYRGAFSKRSLQYVLTSPNKEEFVLFGWSEVSSFCKANGLSEGTFMKALQLGWPPSVRGKNKGWKIEVVRP